MNSLNNYADRGIEEATFYKEHLSRQAPKTTLIRAPNVMLLGNCLTRGSSEV